MKRIRAWQAICAPDNLWRAWRTYASGKRRRLEVAAFALDAPRQVVRLARQLQEERWRPGPYRRLHITRPKRRLIAAAPVRDRVVHHALHQLLSPPWNRSFSDQSFACLPGRGTHRALLRFLAQQRRHRFVLLLDVRRFFYSVDHDTLRRLLLARLPEPPLQRTLDRIIRSVAGLYTDPSTASFLGWDAPGRPGLGLPIGNLTSQWWGNVYLDGLDHYVQRQRRPRAYQRYMDDFTLWGDSREELFQARDSVAAWLRAERCLELSDPGAAPARTDRPVRYLGRIVTPDGLRMPADRVRRLQDQIGRADLDRLEDLLGSARAEWCWP